MIDVKNDHALTLAMSDWVASSEPGDYSDLTYEVAKHVLLDWIAVTAAGYHDESVRMLAELYAGTDGPSSVVGSSRRTRPIDAALVNGTAAHVLDFDDALPAMSGHPACSIVTAALAVAESVCAGGKELLHAIVVGYEVACGVGEIVGPTHYELGFHPTGTVGVIGAAAACSRLLKLSTQQTAHAIGLAATQGSGLKGAFGTMGKSLHAGKAAMGGVLSAQLAQKGFTGPVDILEGKDGFAATHSKAPQVTLSRFGRKRSPMIDRTLFKYHAACHFTHPALDAIAILRARHGFALRDVETVQLTISDRQKRVCDIQHPLTGLDLKFSIRSLAALALDGVDTSAPSSYTPEIFAKEHYRRAAERVILVAPTDEGPHETTVTIRLTGGTPLQERVNIVPESVDVPVQGERLKKKASALLRPLMDEDSIASLLGFVGSIDTAASIQPIGQLIAMQGDYEKFDA